jgi:hypothetical protein
MQIEIAREIYNNYELLDEHSGVYLCIFKKPYLLREFKGN